MDEWGVGSNALYQRAITMRPGNALLQGGESQEECDLDSINAVRGELHRNDRSPDGGMVIF